MWLTGPLCSPVQEKGLWEPQSSREGQNIVTSYKARSLESRSTSPTHSMWHSCRLWKFRFPRISSSHPSRWESICFVLLFLFAFFDNDSCNSQYTPVKYFDSGELTFSQVTSFQQKIPNLPWTLPFELQTLSLSVPWEQRRSRHTALLPLSPEDGKENQEVTVTEVFLPGDFCPTKEPSPGLMTKSASANRQCILGLSHSHFRQKTMS